MLRILLTGFEPFGGSAINPSTEIVRTLAQRSLPDILLATAVLPVERIRGPRTLLDAVEYHRPEAIVCLGEAAGRAALSLERVFVNLLDYRIADNSGELIEGRPIAAGGPDAYLTTLPVEAMRNAILAAGVPAEFSLNAGTFLCNQVSYELLHFLHDRELDLPAGFIHLPQLPEQSSGERSTFPSMPLETMCRGVEAALRVLTRTSWRTT